MDTLKNLLIPGSNALQDTMRLVVIGGAVETARRTAYTGWSSFVDSLYAFTFFNPSFPCLLMSWHVAFSPPRLCKMTSKYGSVCGDVVLILSQVLTTG